MEEFELSYNDLLVAKQNIQSIINGNQRITLQGTAKSGIIAVLGFIAKAASSTISAQASLIATVASLTEQVNMDTKVRYSDFYSSCINTMSGGDYTRIRFKGYCSTKYYSGGSFKWITGFPQVIGYRYKNGIWETAD